MPVRGIAVVGGEYRDGNAVDVWRFDLDLSEQSILQHQRLKPHYFCALYGTAEAVPYKDAERMR